MSESFERYTIERNGSGIRITFDQRKNAAVNFACGIVLAVFGSVTDVTAGPVIMWIGIIWAVLAARGYSSERETEMGDMITYRNGKKVRSMPRNEVKDLVLRLQWRPRRHKKQSVLPWVVEVWGSRKKPFATYSFQDEKPARAFAAGIGEALQMTPTERIERAEAVAA